MLRSSIVWYYWSTLSEFEAPFHFPSDWPFQNNGANIEKAHISFSYFLIADAHELLRCINMVWNQGPATEQVNFTEKVR